MIKAGGILFKVNAERGDVNHLAEAISVVVGDEAMVGRPGRRTPVLLLDVPKWEEED